MDEIRVESKFVRKLLSRIISKKLSNDKMKVTIDISKFHIVNTDEDAVLYLEANAQLPKQSVQALLNKLEASI